MRIRIYNPAYFLKLALNGLIRNSVMTIASIIVLMSSLIITGSSWLIKENADINIAQINGYNKIVVFIEKSAESEVVLELKDRIEEIAGVESVELITKEQALEELFSSYGNYEDILNMYNSDNPLKDSFIITYTDAAMVDTIVYKIENLNTEENTKDSIAKINDRRDVAKKIDDLKSIVSIIFSWIMILLFSVSLFVIINTIKLAVFARRDEISAMRYIGATGLFVAMPFITEGFIIGAISAFLAYFIQYYLYKFFAINILASSGLITVIPFSSVKATVLGGFLLIGILAGIVASMLSLRKYNKA